MKNNSIDALRKDFIAKRRQILLSESTGQGVLSALNEHILVVLRDIEGIILKKIMTIGFYWPIQAEPSVTDTLINWQKEDQKRKLALPKCKPNEALTFYEWDTSTPMVNGFANIPEPANSEPLTIDLMIVPCVGWQLSNNNIWRLGYGGGFYDRTFEVLQQKNTLPFSIGISIDDAEISQDCWSPKSHDFPLDALITESQILLPSKSLNK